jgi:hypothetical protein
MVDIKDSLSRKPFQHSKYLIYAYKNILFFILYQNYIYLFYSTLSFVFVLPPKSTTRAF